MSATLQAPTWTSLPNETTLIINKFQKTAPVDVIGIARELGVAVWELHSLPANISGKIWRDAVNGGPSGFSIGVNASEAFVRKRFTVSHELAHFVLHRNRITNELVEDTMYRGGLSTREEVEANKYAADLLMPYSLIQKFIGDGINNVDEIASRLQVSGVAMRIRLGIPVT